VEDFASYIVSLEERSHQAETDQLQEKKLNTLCQLFCISYVQRFFIIIIIIIFHGNVGCLRFKGGNWSVYGL